MQARYTPVELANKILQKAISNAHKPDAKEACHALRKLEISKEITGYADCHHVTFRNIDEQFEIPIAIALNTSYPRLITYSDTTNVVTYHFNKKVFEEKLLPDIEAEKIASLNTEAPQKIKSNSLMTSLRSLLFSPKTETVTTPLLSEKKLTI